MSLPLLSCLPFLSVRMYDTFISPLHAFHHHLVCVLRGRVIAFFSFNEKTKDLKFQEKTDTNFCPQ